ncbi:MAG: hypothetical protein AAFO04_15370 [Cyanobacteria bacterium J06592_8]
MRTLSTPTIPSWRIALNLPQTYFLIFGNAIGYVSLIHSQGLRLIVCSIGGIICVSAGIAWLLKLQKIQSTFNFSFDLLDLKAFQFNLKNLEQKIITQFPIAWQKMNQSALEIHKIAQEISISEPELHAELIETLYTVIRLVEQGVYATLALHKVQTESYKNQARNYLKASYERLKKTQNNLQQLRDQIVLAQLPETELTREYTLPKRLQILIADNKTVLQASQNLNLKEKKYNEK